MKKKTPKTPQMPISKDPLGDMFAEDLLELCKSSNLIDKSCSTIEPPLRHIRNALHILFLKIRSLEYELKQERERHMSPNPKYF